MWSNGRYTEEFQKSFENQLQQLELRMELNTKQMFNKFSQCLQMVMTKIEELMDDRNDMKHMLDEQILKILDCP